MGIIHRYEGDFHWDGVPTETYTPDRGMQGVVVRRLVGVQEQAPNYFIRYFEVEPGGHSAFDQHDHDHGVVVMRGRGSVLLGDKEFDIAPLDVVYVPGGEVHQFRNTGDEPFGFFCTIPANV